MSRSVSPCTAAPALRMLPPRPTLAGHLVILWLLQSVTVLGYRSTDPEHITAILGQTVHFNCHANFPNDEVVPYVVQWEKRGR